MPSERRAAPTRTLAPTANLAFCRQKCVFATKLSRQNSTTLRDIGHPQTLQSKARDHATKKKSQ